MDAFKPMGPMTKEWYIRQLNYENHMKFKEAEQKKKAFQKEEEKAFEMIPKHPNLFEIKTCTEDVHYDLEDHLLLDNNNSVCPAHEITSYEAKKSPGNETSNSQGMEMTVSAKGISINIPPSDNIYDGDRGNKLNGHNKFTLQNKPSNHDSKKLKHKVKEESTFQKWRRNKMAEPNLYGNVEEIGIDVSSEHAELTKTPIKGVIKSNSKKVPGELSTVSRHITILPRIYERVVGTAINIHVDAPISDKPGLPATSNVEGIKSENNTQEQGELSSVSKSFPIVPCISARAVETGINIDVSICNQPELHESSNVEVICRQLKSKLKLLGVGMAVMLVMMAVTGFCFRVYYFTPSGTDNASENVTATYDVPVTNNDTKCFNVSANCTTFIIEMKTTGKYYFKL